MTTPLPLPANWTPGYLAVSRTAWGSYEVRTPEGYKVSTLYGSSDPLVEAAANAAADYPRLRDELARVTAERHRLAAALAKIVRLDDALGAEHRSGAMRQAVAVARDALRGPSDDADLAAALARIENAHAADADPLTDALLADLRDGGTRTPDRAWEGGGA